MAYNVQPNDILSIRLVTWEPTDSQLGINVLHGIVAALAGTITQGQIAAAIDTGVNGPYKAWMGAPATWRGVGVTKIFPLPRVLEENTSANNGAGTGGAKLCTQQTAGLNSYHTGLAGRRFRGRMYVAFPSDTFASNDGNITAGGVTALAAVATALAFGVTVTSGPNSATIVYGCWGRVTHVFTPYGQVVSNNKFATQRRRGQYGRTNLMPF